MPYFSPDEVARWVSGVWENGMPEGVITGVSHDTRTLEPGNLYVAFRGDQFDGHNFLSQAFGKGASGALVDDHCAWSNNPVLRVSDTLKGLQDLAGGYRKKWKGTVIGITGSVGKTTVKEMCSAVLSMNEPVHCTAGNYNNHIGLPLTMLSMPEEVRYGVFEIGMNHPCEIGPLTALLQPEIGIITDIGSAHREHFGSMEEIAREKALLAELIPASGMVILDCDGEWHAIMRRNVRARVVTVSLGGDADYTGRAVGDAVININGLNYALPLPGEHLMRNALRAVALGLEMGVAPDNIALGLQKFKLPPMRWETSNIRGVEFINDAYNANPLSMRANLKTFSELSGSGAKWAVLGGMLELGDTAEKEHVELGCFVDRLNLDGVIVVGEPGQWIICRSMKKFFRVAEAADAAQILNDHLTEGDRVLLKASRGVRLEQMLEYFKEN